MIRNSSQSSINSSSQMSQSITSSQLLQSSEFGQYKLSFSNNLIGFDENRRRDQIKYQKKLQMYTQPVKDRVLPKNVSETASFIAVASQKISRADSNTSYNQKNNSNYNTNKNSNVCGLSNSKYTLNSNFQNPNIGSYPTILTTSRYQNSGIVQSTQSNNEKIPNLNKPINEEKQESSTTHGISSRDYTYRSMQSTHPNSGEHTNKFSFSRQQSSSQTPVKLINKSVSYNQPSKQYQDNSQHQIKPFFTFNENTFSQISPDTFVSKETQESLTQLKMHTNSSDIISESHNLPSEQIKKFNNHFSKFESYNLEKRCQTLPEYDKKDSCIEDNLSNMSLSIIDCQNSLIQSTSFQQQQKQNLQQQPLQRDSCSFNFHQPTTPYNDDIYSKKNSINSNNNFLNFISQTVANHQGQQRNSYTSSIQFQEQKFIKSLIHKLHLINQENQQNGSMADLTLEGSAFNGNALQEESTPKNWSSKLLDQNENLIKSTQILSNQKINEITPIKSVNQNSDNKNVNCQPIQEQKQITIIRNNSQKSITPIRSLHQKSFSHTNLNNLSKQISQNSLQLTRQSTLQSNTTCEKDYNEVLRTEFSALSPIKQNTLSAVAEKRKERMQFSFSLPKNKIPIKFQDNQKSNTESQQNTARLQKAQGWGCC